MKEASMKKTAVSKFRIKWTNTLRPGRGQSVPMQKDEAERIAAELNADYPGINHEVVPA